MSDFTTHPELAHSLIYGIIRQQAAPLVEDDWAETLGDLGGSPKAFPTWIRGVINDPAPANNGLYVCVSADPALGTSTWDRIITLALLTELLGRPATPGAASTAGNQILFGTGAPAAALGATGDVYLNANNWDIYKKGSSSWVSQGSLRGAAGQNGTNGTNGVAGADGRSAYQLWLLAGNTGSEPEHLLSLRGQNGQNGQNGTNGLNGVDGINGGSTEILFGSGTPLTTLGRNGDIYLNQNNFALFQKVGAVWINRGGLKGGDGVAGVDGQSPQLLSGGSNPAPNVLGVAPGTWYLNTATLELFSREPGGWVSLGSLKGTQGEPGVAGSSSRFLFGAGLPAAGVGSAGDGYIDTTSYYLYGKAGSVWGLQGNIKGTAGVDGAVASRLRTYTGSGAPNDALGLNDDIYINQSNGGLYVKAGGTWALSLILKGDAGVNGTAGRGTQWYLVQGLPAATVGEPGDLGLSTVDGTIYQRGNAAWVSTGASLRGLQGVAGELGPAGIGSRIFSGANAPAEALGAPRDYYIRYNGLLYEKNPSGTWASAGALDFSAAGGSTGTTTIDGRVQFYYGAGIPGNNTTLPATLPEGTIYTDQTGGDLYSRVGGTWEFVLHLVGRPGVAGVPGDPGQSVIGPAGRDGTNGTNGVAGVAGLAGTTVQHYYNTGVPASAFGSNGESYTDIGSTGWNHYNKQNGTWSLLGTLKGAAGPVGSRIIFLAANPGSTDGVIGFMAINTVSGDYFEKVDATTWTLRGNIKGAGGSGGTGTDLGTGIDITQWNTTDKIAVFNDANWNSFGYYTPGPLPGTGEYRQLIKLPTASAYGYAYRTVPNAAGEIIVCRTRLT